MYDGTGFGHCRTKLIFGKRRGKYMELLSYAVTDTTITIYWEKPEENREEITYQIYLEGKLKGATDKTHYTLEELAPDTEYGIRISITGWEAGFAGRENAVKVRTAKKKRRLDITGEPYLAVGDGKTLNTAAIQQALTDCDEESLVYVPAGRFLTGALRLHGGTELYLEEGAVLQGTDDPKDYLPRIPSRFEGLEMECYSSLLNMGALDHTKEPDCENILIHGRGTISGGGKSLAEAVIRSEKERLKDYLEGLGEQIRKEYEKPETIPGRVRPRLINISNCRNVRISGLKLENGAS